MFTTIYRRLLSQNRHKFTNLENIDEIVVFCDGWNVYYCIESRQHLELLKNFPTTAGSNYEQSPPLK